MKKILVTEKNVYQYLVKMQSIEPILLVHKRRILITYYLCNTNLSKWRAEKTAKAEGGRVLLLDTTVLLTLVG